MFYISFGTLRAGAHVTFARKKPYVTINVGAACAKSCDTLGKNETIAERCLADREFCRGLYYRLLRSKSGALSGEELKEK